MRLNTFHYGTMIQNSNKYDFNTVSYYIVDGKLPAGMEMKKNGGVIMVFRQKLK